MPTTTLPHPDALDNPDVRPLLGHPVAYFPAFTRLTGSTIAGLMLSQAFYWAQRTKDPEGWFWKTQEEWAEETALKRGEQERARRLLCTFPFWQEERRGLPARLYFRLNLRALHTALLGETESTCTVEMVIARDAPHLRSLGKTVYMRCRKAGIAAEPVDYVDVLRTKGMVCGICGEPIRRSTGQRPGDLSFDHIVPLNAGGTHTFDNLQPAHSDCNYRKGDPSENSEQKSQFAYGKPASLLPPSRLVLLPQADQAAYPKPTITEITTETTLEIPPEMMNNVGTNVGIAPTKPRRQIPPISPARGGCGRA